MIRPYSSLNVLKPQVPSRSKSESNESILRLGVEEQPLFMTVAKLLHKNVGDLRRYNRGARPGEKLTMALSLREELICRQQLI
jgi:hypothetical protein